jgi:hypothetical protein
MGLDPLLVTRMKFVWVPSPNGGALLKELAIVPNFIVDPNDGGFERAKLDALADAAVKYVAANRLNCLIRIESA